MGAGTKAGLRQRTGWGQVGEGGGRGKGAGNRGQRLGDACCQRPLPGHTLVNPLERT